MENYTDEEDMDDFNLDNERGHHWRKVIEDNDGGVDDAKALLHANRWDVYVNEKGKLVKGRYSVEVFGHYREKVIWEVVDDHVIEDLTDHDDK